MYGGIEAGGTKFICAVADEQLGIQDKISIPTTTPEETIQKVVQFFSSYSITSLGIGSFGPIGVDRTQATYGHILSTPKPGWAQIDFLGMLKEHLNVPMEWTTDVNAAAYGELQLGAAKGKSSCIYLTIGTGIGGGIVLNNQILQGTTHPELGHIFVKRHKDDTYAGSCPYHQDCLEGLAAGPSLEARTGIKGQLLPADHEIWSVQAYYLAQALVNYTVTVAPEMIVLGGGVMNQPHLLDEVRKHFVQLLNHYVVVPTVEEYIVRWGLPNESGIYGALLLARDAANQ